MTASCVVLGSWRVDDTLFPATKPPKLTKSPLPQSATTPHLLPPSLLTFSCAHKSTTEPKPEEEERKSIKEKAPEIPAAREI
jgi:hypothetical protein